VSVETSEVRTSRGDAVVLTLFDHAGEDPTILLSVLDADDTPVPTAEFTFAEAALLREELRRMCERVVRGGR